LRNPSGVSVVPRRWLRIWRGQIGRCGQAWSATYAGRQTLAAQRLSSLSSVVREAEAHRCQRLTRGVKVMLDRTVAGVALLLLSPVLLVLAVLIAFTMGRPVLFRQRRPGYRGQPFYLVKFRTMRSGDLPDDERLTRVGRFLRASSLDHLPELWNVLTGDVSLVGPRPLLMVYLDRYTPRQARRHEVKPGMTGWAQVNGRNALDWDEKFELDIWYVDHWSLGLDLKILARTVGQVLRRRGISHPGNATMPEFVGSGPGRGPEAPVE
jgi:sugar transferase EpsL